MQWGYLIEQSHRSTATVLAQVTETVLVPAQGLQAVIRHPEGYEITLWCPQLAWELLQRERSTWSPTSGMTECPRRGPCVWSIPENLNFDQGGSSMKIAELFGKGKTVFSCEVFPPKKDSPVDTIYQTLDAEGY